MSRTRPDGSRVFGPQSALTDFLASHNISAAEIRRTVEERRRIALEQEAQLHAANEQAEGTSDAARRAATIAKIKLQAKRQRALSDKGRPKAKGKAKAKGKGKAKAKVNGKGKGKAEEEDDDVDEGEDDEEEVNEEAEDKAKNKAKDQDYNNSYDINGGDMDSYDSRGLRSKPLPGQLENCGNPDCGTRFTVTPYTLATKDKKGLLCPKCSKAADDAGRQQRSQVVAQAAARKRQMRSLMLDGIAPTGPRSLLEMCIDVLTANVHLADSLGNIPEELVDKIARNLSKRRKMNSNSVKLFCRSDAEIINVYDCARVKSDDMISILQQCVCLKELKFKNAIAFSDRVMDFLTDSPIELESLYLHGANLLTDEAWARFIKTKGHALKSIRVYYTDRYFGDEMLALVRQHCHQLERLKVYHNQKVTHAGLYEIAQMKQLKRLGVQIYGRQVPTDVYVNLVEALGENLHTLSLKDVETIEDPVLDAIHKHAKHLVKLRITGSDSLSDKAFTALFTDWANPALEIVDWSKCRYRSERTPRENPLNVGLCSEGFLAMMRHSRAHIISIDINSCRHITADALQEAFASGTTYPELRTIELSFIEAASDHIVELVFKACPKLRQAAVFGCFKVKNVKVPKGCILQGVPTAKGMLIEGTD